MKASSDMILLKVPARYVFNSDGTAHIVIPELTNRDVLYFQLPEKLFIRKDEKLHDNLCFALSPNEVYPCYSHGDFQMLPGCILYDHA